MNIRTFDLNLLRIFEAILHERNVSHAAIRVGLSQASVSNALSRMRQLTGDQLFMRTRNGMEPSSYALRLAVPVQQGLALIRKGFEESGNFAPENTDRTFTLLMADVDEVVFLPKLLLQFAKAAPQARLKVKEIEISTVASELESGNADLAVAFVPPLGRAFTRQMLFADSFVGFLRNGNPLLRSSPPGRLTMKAYRSATHVRIVPPSGKTDFLTDHLAKALPEIGGALQVGLWVPHFMVLPEILAQSDLVATVPRKVVASLNARRDLVSVELPFDVPTVAVHQCWHVKQQTDPANLWLRRLIAENFVEGDPPVRGAVAARRSKRPLRASA